MTFGKKDKEPDAPVEPKKDDKNLDTDGQESPAGPGNDKDPVGAQNPPADFGGEDVVEAKAKVNPQAVGGVLSGAAEDAVMDPLDELNPSAEAKTALEHGLTDQYMKDQAPLEADEHEGKLRTDKDNKDDDNDK